jgi:twitching motility protein PilT
VQSIYRIVNVFPPHQQPQIRQLLAFVLQAVVSQQLIPKSHGHGRVMAMEILIPNSAVRNLIREDKLHQLYSTMQAGQTESGMQTMNQALFKLVQAGFLTKEDATGVEFCAGRASKNAPACLNESGEDIAKWRSLIMSQ